VLDVGEQCDDGNARNTDGCSTSCQFEQVHKIIDLNIDRTVGSCVANRFGGAFTAAGATQTNNGIDASIKAGTTSILLDFLGLEDPAADDDLDGLEVGIVNSTPVRSGPAAYDGNAPTDLDWWYTPDGSLLDAEQLPVNRLPTDLTAGALTTTSPGSAQIGLTLSGSPTLLSLSTLRLSMSIGADSTPLASTGNPPGHVAEEHLDPALQSFATTGAGNTGILCGDIGAASMAATPIPAGLVGTCVTPPPGPTPVYTAANTLLDVFVSGCTTVVFGIAVVAIQPAQPDHEVPGVPSAGTGFPYELIPNPTTKSVSSCEDKDNGTVPLADCLADASYSSHFRFTSQRVIARDDLIFGNGFEDSVI
jgi:cysteine-rich repeat protein